MPYIGREMMLKCFRKKRKNVFFYEKNTLVPFCFVNKELKIFKGLDFKKYTYRKKQLGMNLGEFAKTRATAYHKGKRLKITKKRQRSMKSFFTYDLKSDYFTR